MAREVPYGMKIEGGAGMPLGNWKSGVTVRKSVSGKVTRTGTVAKKKSEVESTSYRGKELTKSQRKKIREQNKAAESAKSKDLDKVEAAKKAAKTRKANQKKRERNMYLKGAAAGTAGGVVLTSGLYAYGNKDKDKKSKSNNKKK